MSKGFSVVRMLAATFGFRKKHERKWRKVVFASTLAQRMQKGPCRPSERSSRGSASVAPEESAGRSKYIPPPRRVSDRYTTPDDIWSALDFNLLPGDEHLDEATRQATLEARPPHVRLVRMSWLLNWLRAKRKKNNSAIGGIPRRQDLPEDAFISADELRRIYGAGNLDGVLPIIAISYW